MGAFGTILGTILGIGGLILTIYTTWVFTNSLLILLLYPLFGLTGGFALGALNTRKARTYSKYKNEYIFYVTASLMIIIGLTVFYMFFDPATVKNALVGTQFGTDVVIGLSALGAIMMVFGLGLVVANSVEQ